MSKDKCCGNCKRYKPLEEIDGMCTLDYYPYDKDYWCDCYKPINNGWTEITPDNVEELYESKERVCVAFVCNGEVSYMCGHFGITLSTMAKYGGYYYYVLPELKIE